MKLTLTFIQEVNSVQVLCVFIKDFISVKCLLVLADQVCCLYLQTYSLCKGFFFKPFQVTKPIIIIVVGHRLVQDRFRSDPSLGKFCCKIKMYLFLSLWSPLPFQKFSFGSYTNIFAAQVHSVRGCCVIDYMPYNTQISLTGLYTNHNYQVQQLVNIVINEHQLAMLLSIHYVQLNLHKTTMHNVCTVILFRRQQSYYTAATI